MKYIFASLIFFFGCIVLITFLPSSSETYLKVKSSKVDLDGVTVDIDTVVNSIDEKSAMNGHIYIHYRPDDLDKKGCHLEVKFSPNDTVPSSGKTKCRSGDEKCNSNISEKNRTVRMFLDIKKKPIAPITISVSLVGGPTDETLTCPMESLDLQIVPEWYRPNFWELALAR